MKRAWKHITTGQVISDEAYALLGIVSKAEYVPLIKKYNDSYIRK
jgi:hypothetical protein